MRDEGGEEQRGSDDRPGRALGRKWADVVGVRADARGDAGQAGVLVPRLGASPRRGRRSKPREVSFAPVELVPASVAVPAVEVTLPGGVRLAIGSSATAELVAAVIEGLRRGC